MSLTPSQYQALAADIRAKAAANFGNFAAWVSAHDYPSIANWYNSQSTSWVWRSSITLKEVLNLPGFNFTLVDGLTPGKRDEFDRYIFSGGYTTPSNSNIRAGIKDVWNGTAAKDAVRDTILSAAKRLATQLESLSLTLAGTDAGADGTQANPKNLTWEGIVMEYEIDEALRNY